ncbi:histidine ammonia-lyase [Candidatus Obscuribacterales bacterium]|nr:histidine ammonia-lyase [Candidatus Obscuribacterales bacterium]
MSKPETLFIDGNSLSLEDVAAVAAGEVEVDLSQQTVIQIKDSRNRVEQMLNERQVVYGITTGFGKFKDVYIPPEDSLKLQRNFLLSHAVGVGPNMSVPETRATMLLRANALAKGFSGIRHRVVQLLIEMLNSGVHPLIPEQGSVGASGDLAPLAHLALVLIGEGEAEYKGKYYEGREALTRAGLRPVILQAKEGLALTNGTQVMTAIGSLVLKEALNIAKIADIIGAMSLEALLGTKKAFDPQVHKIRPHKGQMASARNLRLLVQDSDLMESHKNCGMVQDAYSLRCMPQVHGASRQALDHARVVLETEINSATDNPLIFDSGVISAGNFHGQPVALVMDYVAASLAELANISERRTERMVNPSLSNGLPPFLILNGGLNSGFMIAQYTAAALVSENKSLAHPASVDSIPTSANQEDHVSMGTIGARKARSILKNLKYVLAIELLCAAQGLDLRTGYNMRRDSQAFAPEGIETKSQSPGKGVEAAHTFVREHISHLAKDRLIKTDIETAFHLIDSGEFLAAVEDVVGVLM